MRRSFFMFSEGCCSYRRYKWPGYPLIVGLSPEFRGNALVNAKLSRHAEICRCFCGIPTAERSSFPTRGPKLCKGTTSTRLYGYYTKIVEAAWGFGGVRGVGDRER
jgi:hypothetical protein